MEEQQGASLFAAALRAFPLLRHLDHESWLVGGAVRDLVLGRVPRDADVAVRGAADAAERFAKREGARMVRLGAAPFDVIRVVARGAVYDFAEIVGDTIEEDLGRRDFTIGAIALPLAPPHELVDPFAGRRDLESGTLRMVRESNFSDDPLRVVRGLRLLAELSLTIEPATLDAMRRHARQVGDAAPERLGVEWLALLSAGDADALRRSLELVRDLKIDGSLVGGALDAAAIARAAETRGEDATARLAAMVLRGDEAAACERSVKLGFGAARIDAVRRACHLARHLLDGCDLAIDPVVLHDHGEDAARRAVAIARAEGRTGLADAVADFVAREGARIFGTRPLLDGHVISATTGIAPGPRIGAIRRALLEAQLRGDVASEAEAREFVRRMAGGGGR